MSQVNDERKTLEVLAEEFASRYRRGEHPALSEYIAAHPELAAEIRELFPTLVMMEELAPGDSESLERGKECHAGIGRSGIYGRCPPPSGNGFIKEFREYRYRFHEPLSLALLIRVSPYW